jgi:hypothetical protein
MLVAIIGGLFYGNRQFDQVGRRIDDLRAEVSSRLASVEVRFAGMESRVETRFAQIETRMEMRFSEIHQQLLELRGLLHDALRPRAS